MQSKARLLGHPVHQMLIVFPLGLLATAVIFDVIHIVLERSVTATVSYRMIAAGIIGGLVAAPFGWIVLHSPWEPRQDRRAVAWTRKPARGATLRWQLVAATG